MAFDNLESSIEDGRPLYLYRFSLGDKVWRYTSAFGDVEAGGFNWKTVPIADDGPNQTGEASTDALRITASTSITPVQIYLAYPPAKPVQLAIFIGHEGDSEIKAIYQGEVTQCNVPQPGTAVLTCETLSSTMAREGLRLGWQRNCPYALYDPVTCRVNKAAYAAIGTVSKIVDNLVTVPALVARAENYFAGGFVEWTDPVRGLERRSVETSKAGVLMMFGTADGIVVGTVVTAYPGCARTTTACKAFNNLANYGGVPAFQGKSPFDGNPVFY